MKDMMGAMAMGDMLGGMDHAAMNHDMKIADMPKVQHESMASMEHGEMKHSAKGMPMPKAHHAKTEDGPSVDMRVDMPRTNRDDPGINMRNNRRHVFTYADLPTIGRQL